MNANELIAAKFAALTEQEKEFKLLQHLRRLAEEHAQLRAALGESQWAGGRCWSCNAPSGEHHAGCGLHRLLDGVWRP